MFDSLNFYNDIQTVQGRTPDDLAAVIRSIKVPIKIVQIVSHANQLVCFFVADGKVKKVKQEKNEKQI